MENKKGKNSMIVYYDTIECLEDFSDEQVGKMFRAMIEYDKSGKLPEFTGELKVAFRFIKSALDANIEKYNSICERNKINGQKGGRPRNPENPVGFLETQENPEKPKKPDNDNDNDNDIDIDIDTDNDNKKENILKEIFDYWNSKNIIVHREITDNIKKAINKVLKIYTKEQIKEYIDRYTTVINDKSYFFSYKWTLIDFLNRKDGISSFADDGSKWVNYCSSKMQTNIIQPKKDNTMNILKDLYQKYSEEEL